MESYTPNIFMDSKTSSEKILKQIQSGKCGEIFDGLCKINEMDNSIIIDLAKISS